jgi:nitrogen fixation protein FixH
MKTWNPWPFGLFLTLATFVVIQLGVVTLATTSFEGLDDVEYYRHGVEYGKEIARQKMQSELGWKLDPKVTGGQLYLAIVDADGKPVRRAEVLATVGRPATLREDSEHRLSEVGPGIYQAPLTLAPGSWRIRLEVNKGETLVKAEFRQQGGDS